MVPEDQALYVCEAQNVFGKVRAEARLVVTGHGSLVDLGEEGLVGRLGPSQGGPRCGRPPSGTDVSVPGSPREPSGSLLPGQCAPESVPLDP